MPRQNKKSGHKVATFDESKKDDKGEKSWPKSHTNYWLERVFKIARKVDGEKLEDPDFTARIAHDGRRERFPLKTANKSEAAGKAAQIYRDVVAKGWESALTAHKPNAVRDRTVKQGVTVGQFIALARSLSSARERTLDEYAKAFRRIVAGVFTLGEGHKFDAKKGGAAAWRKKVDAVKLVQVTPARVLKWKNAYLTEHNGDPTQAERAVVTVNALLRNAGALFAKKLLPFLAEEIVLPSPLPLEGVPKDKEPSRRYQSKVDAGAILKAAHENLATENPEAFKLLLLSLVCGLRRSEADTLTWAAFDFAERTLRIESTEHHRLKSADSEGVLTLDEQTASIFQGFRANASGEFVLESPFSPKRKSRSYRCDRTQRELIAWLKRQGVEANRPIHTMRKEIGAVIATNSGIYAASRYLRHSDVRVTAQYYADQKEAVTVDLAELIATAPGEQG